MKPYISLYESKIKKFKRFTEASFNPQKFNRILELFNSVIGKRIGETMYGDPNLYSTINIAGKDYFCVSYNFSKGKSIRYKYLVTKSAEIHSIDIFLKPYSLIPSFVLENISGLNIVQLVDAVSQTIINKKSGEYVVFTESSNTNKRLVLQESGGLKDLSFAKNIRSLVGDFLLSLKGKDLKFALDTINSDDGLEYKKLHDLYNKYRKANKQKPDKYYTNFKATIKKQLVTDGERKGKVVGVKPPRKKAIPQYKSSFIKDRDPYDRESMTDEEREFDEKYTSTVKETFSKLEEKLRQIINPTKFIKQNPNLAEAQRYGLIILGDPGTGKTWTTQEILSQEGFKEYMGTMQLEWEEDEETGKKVPIFPYVKDNEYVYFRNSVTPEALYAYLYIFNDRILVFDDCDTALTSAPNLIKAATDTYPRRKVQKSTVKAIINYGNKEVIPPSFLYTGRVIFITNLDLGDVDSANFTRNPPVRISLSADEVVDRAKSLFPVLSKKFKNPKKNLMQDALNWVIKCNSMLRQEKLDLRTFETCVTERLKNSPDWKKRIYELLKINLKVRST